MSRKGWRYPVRPTPWPELRAWYHTVIDDYPDFWYLIEIVRSIETSGVADRLGAFTSMYDLRVAIPPFDEVPVEVICVGDPLNVSVPQVPGSARICFLGHAGLVGDVVCSPGEAVPIFWRFVREQFGLERGAGWSSAQWRA